jgi:hypothetical protein
MAKKVYHFEIVNLRQADNADIRRNSKNQKVETNRLTIRFWKKRNVKDLVERLSNRNISRWLAFMPFHNQKKMLMDG